jgi:CheY-like chemotaxis protein
MKILLVDDSKTMRNIQKKVLTSLGDVTFGEAGDGLEALSIIAATAGGYDLRAGVNNYLLKPFTPESLMEKVQVTLAKVKAAA